MSAPDARMSGRDEPPVEPDLPICDAHHHLWTHRGRYLVEAFVRDARDGHNVVSSVFIACESMRRGAGPAELQPVGETEFIDALVRDPGTHGSGVAIARGIVGYADLTLGAAIGPVLDAHVAASPARFRGIRHTVSWDASPAIRTSAPHPRAGVTREPEFVRGVSCLARHGLAFDALLFHPQLDEFAALARDVPEVPMILDHVGLPLGIGPYADRRDRVLDDWRRDIAALGPLDNVTIKLGGFGMPRFGFGWDTAAETPGSTEVAERIAPYVRHCIECVGAQRCMFESNFPVDAVSYSYRVIWNAFKHVTRELPAAARAALFHDTAIRTYRLDA